MSQIYWFQYSAYLSAQLPRKTYNFKGSQRIQRYTENTLHRRKIEMVNARLLVQQFTHPVHPNSSYRLSNLLQQFVDNTEEIRNRQQTKKQGEKQARQYTGKHFSFQKNKGITVTCPVKLVVLPGSPSCYPYLLSLLRRTHELLANSGLL